MGEVIKTFGVIDIKGKRFDVELNAPVTRNSGGTVHIQSEYLRIDMSQVDFYRFVGQLNLAKANLEKLKGIDNE